jgi:ABC-type multidrug transport system fused ATPase/permease subunit
MVNLDGVQATCIVFAVVGTAALPVLNTKELPRKYGFYYTHNSWDLRFVIRRLLLLVCIEFVGFYYAASLIFSFSYYGSKEPLSIYTNKAEFVTVCLVCGLFFVFLACVARQTVWTAVVASVIFTVIMHVLFTCNQGEDTCFWLKFLITVVIFVALMFLFKGVTSIFATRILPLMAHVTVCYTAVQSYAVIVKGFEYWQLDNNYWWIPIVLTVGMATARFFAEWMVMHTTCFGLDGVASTLRNLAGDIDGNDLDREVDRLEEEARKEKLAIKEKLQRLAMIKATKRQRETKKIRQERADMGDVSDSKAAADGEDDRLYSSDLELYGLDPE